MLDDDGPAVVSDSAVHASVDEDGLHGPLSFSNADGSNPGLEVTGNLLPLTDLLVAVVVQRCDAWIYTTDPHFDLIPNLKRLAPVR